MNGINIYSEIALKKKFSYAEIGIPRKRRGTPIKNEWKNV